MTTTSVSDPMVGNVLGGRYAIERRIARGGMATVYEATDRRLQRTVAVKIMHEGLGDDDDFAGRFDREARAAARLSHPNIVSVFDRGQDLGRPFIVMEYVPGITMRRVISRRAPLPPATALAHIEEVLLALVAAHENQIVHRDIKPENILLDEREQVKVADFGLARAITAQTATATQGLLIGTVSYLPPELVTEGRATPRSDVYSTGVVLYEMLTGAKPHTGDSPIQVAYAHVHNDVPPPSAGVAVSWRESERGIPPYVDALVRAATRRDPSERPADAREFLAMVRRARRSLAAGVMNDPGLTADFQRRFATEPPLPATPVSPLSPDRVFDGASGGSAAGAGLETTRIAEPADHQIHPLVPASPPSPDLETAPDDEPRRGTRRVLGATLLVLTLLVGLGGGWWFTEGRWHDVPNLVTMTEPEATRAASDAGLTVTFTEAFDDAVPAGAVISTDPGVGDRLLADQEIHAVLSRGPELFGVPEVAGRTLDEATAAITQASLRVGTISEEWDAAAPEGTVLTSSIAPGQEVRRDTPVDLTVSKGPEPIDVPTVVGERRPEAERAIEDAGFTHSATEEFSDTVPAGTVISQNPRDTTLFAGDNVAIVVSKGPETVAMPNVVAMKVDAATRTLRDAGLEVETKESDNFLDLGFVSRTDPEPGQQVAKGTKVTLYLV